MGDSGGVDHGGGHGAHPAGLRRPVHLLGVAAGDPFREGEPVLLFDDRDRRYLLHLRAEGVFQYHFGSLPHSALIGSPEGGVFRSSKGAPLTALRPRLGDYILKMRRGPQVVYPKDLGAVLLYADIYPGLTVLEAGTGSGALAMTLTRAVGPAGRVISYEVREDHARHGRAALVKHFGELPDWLELRTGDVADGLEEAEADRLVLDIPEPWEAAERAAARMRPGAVVCCYLPTVPQVERLHRALEETGRFIDAETFEVLRRTWNIRGRSVRPDHGMVGHTGFITTARLFLPEEDPPPPPGEGP